MQSTADQTALTHLQRTVPSVTPCAGRMLQQRWWLKGPPNSALAQVDEVKGIMSDNIEKVLARGEKLELLVDKTDNLMFEVRAQGALFVGKLPKGTRLQYLVATVWGWHINLAISRNVARRQQEIQIAIRANSAADRQAAWRHSTPLWLCCLNIPRGWACRLAHYA